MTALIGIDPGKNTGVALWDSSIHRLYYVQTLGIIKAMELVINLRAEYAGEVQLFIEDARLRKWFKDSPGGRDKKLQGVGSVKRDCAIWEEFCQHLEISYTMIHPRIVPKYNSDQFRKLTGHKGRTSQHARDAAMIVYKREVG